METKDLSESITGSSNLLDVSKNQLLCELMLKESHVNPDQIRTGTLTDKDWENLINAADIVWNRV